MTANDLRREYPEEQNLSGVRHRLRRKLSYTLQLTPTVLDGDQNKCKKQLIDLNPTKCAHYRLIRTACKFT